MNLSYWEIKTWFTYIDFAIVGSGIVGLSCALHLREKYPNAKILILEKGILPQGASTKNAGFACFGSLSELIDDLQQHSEEEVLNLVKQRWEGLQLLRKTLSDKAIGFKNYGGYEIFQNHDSDLFERCESEMRRVNQLLRSLFKQDAFSIASNPFGFRNCVESVFYNPLEAQIDTGQMMLALLRQTQSKNIQVLNSIEVKSFKESLGGVTLETSSYELSAKKLIVATNGFASQLLSETVKPARAQVLITKPIHNLKIKGTFHLDKGYSYFRNIDNRLLIGGGRNLDFNTEETTEFGQTKRVQTHLETLFKTVILPDTAFEIDHRWSGIMGVGRQKRPIVKQLSDRVFCGVRLGGMGIAIGSSVGKELADLICD